MVHKYIDGLKEVPVYVITWSYIPEIIDVKQNTSALAASEGW